MKPEIYSSSREAELRAALLLLLKSCALCSATYFINTLAFPSKVKKRIKGKAGGECQDCRRALKRDEIICAHILHGTEPKLQVPENGKVLCPFCETKYHLSNVCASDAINLPEAQNVETVSRRMYSLPEDQRFELIREYPVQWELVCDAMGDPQGYYWLSVADPAS